MHLRTQLLQSKSRTPAFIKSNMSTKSQYALVNWLEADSFSIISVRKILSPPVAGAICTVKNYKHCLTRILAVGTESEMDRKLLETQKFAILPSPKKRRRPSLPFIKDIVTCKTRQAQQRSLIQPEPDIQWYMHPTTPQKPKQSSLRSIHSDTCKDCMMIIILLCCTLYYVQLLLWLWMNKHLINIGATQHTIHMSKMTQVRNTHLYILACMSILL